MLNIIEIKYQRKQLKKIIFLKKEKLIIIIVLDVIKIWLLVYVLKCNKTIEIRDEYFWFEFEKDLENYFENEITIVDLFIGH